MKLRKWEDLPQEMQNDEVRKYYEILKKKKASLMFKRIFGTIPVRKLFVAWLEDVSMPVIDCLGDEFLNYVKDGMKITVSLDGTVTVEE